MLAAGQLGSAMICNKATLVTREMDGVKEIDRRERETDRERMCV